MVLGPSDRTIGLQNISILYVEKNTQIREKDHPGIYSIIYIKPYSANCILAIAGVELGLFASRLVDFFLVWLRNRSVKLSLV